MDTRLELYQKIIAVYYENGGIYGAPKIVGVLNKSGIKCSVSTVSRAMKLLGIMSIVPKRFRRKASSMTPAEKKLIVNLVKDMKASYRQGTALKSDITRYELQLQSLELSLTSVKDKIDVLSHKLATAVGLEPD